MTIQDLFNKYLKKIAPLDLELIIAHVIKKSREFVLAHPEYKLTQKNELRIKNYANRRIKNEPLAYILGYKEFYGLDFKITKDTLIPRPETEMLVELAMQEIRRKKKEVCVIDVGTGSGNIIISLAKNLKNKKIKFIGVDISKKALRVAKHNAKKNLNKKIKFIHGNLLDPIIENCQPKAGHPLGDKLKIENSRMIILANLPYLSKKIYNRTSPDVKNYEPKSALYSPQNGLAHYKKLLNQIKTLRTSYFFLPTSCFMEFSPEQKNNLHILIKKILPSAQIEFAKDLAQKWRICAIKTEAKLREFPEA